MSPNSPYLLGSLHSSLQILAEKAAREIDVFKLSQSKHLKSIFVFACWQWSLDGKIKTGSPYPREDL
jgi:hypothetical protein